MKMKDKKYYEEMIIKAITSCSFAEKLITDRNIEINSNISLINDIAIESIQLLEYLITLEDMLGVELDFEELDMDVIDKIDDFAEYLFESQKRGVVN